MSYLQSHIIDDLDDLDDLDTEFHNTLSDLEAAIASAHKEEKHPIEAFGRCVTLARKIVALDEAMGIDSHEQYVHVSAGTESVQ
jgi:hypothetical protein